MFFWDYFLNLTTWIAPECFLWGFPFKPNNLDGTRADGVLENVGVEDGEAAGPSGELK